MYNTEVAADVMPYYRADYLIMMEDLEEDSYPFSKYMEDRLGAAREALGGGEGEQGGQIPERREQEDGTLPHEVRFLLLYPNFVSC